MIRPLSRFQCYYEINEINTYIQRYRHIFNNVIKLKLCKQFVNSGN